MPTRQFWTTVLSMVVVFILQVAIAPSLALSEVVVEISLCFVIVNALQVSQSAATICAFILGVLIDLASGSPLGVRAFSYSLVAYSINPLAGATMLDSLLARYIALVVMVFSGELVIALLQSIIGVDSDLTHSLLTRVLPGGLYDSVVGLFFLPLLRSKNNRDIRQPKSKKSLKETLPPV